MLRAEELQDADAATQRTALLDEASMTLSRSLDLETTVAEADRLLVPRFADWCLLQLLRHGRLGFTSAIVAPLTGRDGVVGAVR